MTDLFQFACNLSRQHAENITPLPLDEHLPDDITAPVDDLATMLDEQEPAPLDKPIDFWTMADLYWRLSDVIADPMTNADRLLSFVNCATKALSDPDRPYWIGRACSWLNHAGIDQATIELVRARLCSLPREEGR